MLENGKAEWAEWLVGLEKAAQEATPSHRKVGSKTTPTRGVAIVVHGLNLLARRMDSLGQWLLRQDIEVLRVSLQGHGDLCTTQSDQPLDRQRLEAFKQATFPIWLEELSQAYQIARQRADELSVPLYFVGYSLGGLLGNNLLNRPSLQATFEKMILLAPALEITPMANLLRPLFRFPRFGLPSATPPGYCANPRTPMIAYRGLFEAYYEIHRTRFHGSHIPTLVISDVNDAMVPFQGLLRVMQQYQLPWEILPLRQRAHGKRRDYHLIIDEVSVGQSIWQDMTKRMKEFLSGSEIPTPQRAENPVIPIESRSRGL